MPFYTKQHQFYCGIDLHARPMDLCVLDHDGAILLPQNMPDGPETFLQAIAPSRDDLVVAVERCGSGAADSGSDAGADAVSRRLQTLVRRRVG
jgi:hypothetical protein